MADNRPVVANLDFQDIKQDMIDYFKSRPEFADYEFTGSGLNLLMDILAYNTHYNSLAANFLVNEMFLDSAVMRNNVVSIAKALNYQPRSASASTTTITLRVPKRTSEEQFTVIPAGSLFSAVSGNSTFNFYTTRDYTVQFATTLAVGQTVDVDVVVSEGTLITQRFVQTAENTSFPTFELANTNVDTTSLVVSVNGTRYNQITPEDEGIVQTTRTSQIFFVEETRNRNHRLIFGNGVIGEALTVGDEIIATYLVTNGAAANGVRSFTVTIPGRSDISITGSPSPSSGGGDPETIREIKDTAPHWYQAQYRAVTENDYGAILRKKFADIQSISVYGGEKVGQPGKVFVAVKPISGDTLSDGAKNTIENEILSTANVVTIRPEVLDPFILNIVLKTVVVYDNTKLATTPAVLEARVLTMYDRFNTTYIGEFLENFRVSQLSAEIDNIDTSIVSSNTRVSLRVDLNASNSRLNTYEFSFRNTIYHPEDGFKADQGGVLSSNLFTRQGRPYSSGFDEDGRGTIRLYDFIDNEKVYINNQAGTINYETGEIELTQGFDPEDGTISITVIPESFDVTAENDTILRIATNDSRVEVVEKNETAVLRALNLSRSA